MKQIIIHLDADLEAKVATAAKAMNLSKRDWIINLLEEKLRATWPEDVKTLAGAWEDFPTSEELRKAPGKDIERNKL